MRFIVYILHNDVSNHVYVGKSCSGLRRPKRHGSAKYIQKNKHIPVVRWIQKYRTQSIDYKITILEERTCAEELNEAECFYIAYFKSIGTRLLNCTDGGDGMANPSPAVRNRLIEIGRQRYKDGLLTHLNNKGRSLSADTRKKIAATKIGRSRSASSKEKMSVAARNRSPQVRLNMSIAAKNRSPEAKARLAQSRVGRVVTTETRLRLSIALRRPPRVRINLLGAS